MRIKRKDMLKFLYILSMVFAFLGNIYVQIFVGMIWIGHALVIRKDIIKNIEFYKFIRLFLIPCVLIHLYTIILILMGVGDFEIFSTNLLTYSSVGLAIVSVFMFGVDIIKYDFAALSLSWLLQVIKLVYLNGLVIFKNAILQGWFDISVGKNYLELHDLVLAIGYFWVWYLFSNKKNKRNSGLLALLLLIIFVIGVKRIAIFADIVVTVFYLITKNVKGKNQFEICKIVGWIALLFCIMYIYILSEGNVFYEFMNAHGINLMSRDYFYKYIMSLTKFSPMFFGYGRGSVKKLMTNAFHDYANVHSDFVKMYVEIGFIFYIIWLWYYLIYVIKVLERRYGKQVAIYAFCVTIYTFMLYLTDNTESYFICSLIRTTAPICAALNAKQLRKKEIKG